MTLPTDEFIQRFLIHVLPSGFHRIRHYGLLANKSRAKHLARARVLLQVPQDISDDRADHDAAAECVYVCKVCGAPMVIIEILNPDHAARAPPIGPP